MKKVSIRIEYILSVIIAGVLTVFLLADSESFLYTLNRSRD